MLVSGVWFLGVDVIVCQSRMINIPVTQLQAQLSVIFGAGQLVCWGHNGPPTYLCTTTMGATVFLKPWEASFSMVRTIGHTACSCNQTYNCQSWANVKVVLQGVGNSELDFFTHIVDKQCEIIKKGKAKNGRLVF